MDLLMMKTNFSIDIEHVIMYFFYLITSLLILTIFAKIYIKFTPYNEIEQIKSGNLAVSIAFSGAILGFAINLGFAATYSHNIYEYVLYGMFSTLIQLFCYKLIGFIFKDFAQEIKNYGSIPVAVIYATIAVSVGIINGVCGL